MMETILYPVRCCFAFMVKRQLSNSRKPVSENSTNALLMTMTLFATHTADIVSKCKQAVQAL